MVSFDSLYSDLQFRQHCLAREFKTRTRIRSLDDPVYAHGWDKLDLATDFDQQHFKAYRYPAKGPRRGVVAFMTGCESTPLFNRVFAKEMSAAGFDVVGLPLVRLSDRADNMAVNKQLNQWFLLDEHSPLHTDYDASVPKFVVTHSAGSLYTFNTLLDKDNAEQVKSMFKGIMPISSFFDSANSSLLCDGEKADLGEHLWREFTSRAYTGYTSLPFVGNTRLGHGPLDRFVIHTDAAHEGIPTPTHNEARSLRFLGREVTKQLIALQKGDPAHPLFHLPIHAFISQNDAASCPKVQDYIFGHVLHAPVAYSHHGHDISPETKTSIVSLLKQATPLPEPAAAPLPAAA